MAFSKKKLSMWKKNRLTWLDGVSFIRCGFLVVKLCRKAAPWTLIHEPVAAFINQTKGLD